MSLPAGYTSRPVTPEDRSAVLSIIAASDLTYVGEEDYAAEDLDDEWGRARFDLAADPVLVLAPDGTPVAYQYLWESEPGAVVVAWFAVYPEHDTVELETWLLDRAEARARERLAGSTGPTKLRCVAYESETIAPALFRERGFTPVRFFWRMAIPLTGAETPPEPPGGMILRAFDPRADARAAHAVMQEAFVDHWGTPTAPFEEWTQDFMSGPEYDPTLWLLAEEDGEVAGCLIARRTGDRGWIGELGVRPAWRGRGVGAALLRASFARFARRGAREVILSVDSDNVTGATRLYERVGMTSRFRFDFYDKPL